MKFLTGILCVFFYLSSPVWSTTFLSDSDFNGAADIISTTTYNGAENEWLTDGGWYKYLSDPYDGTLYAECNSNYKSVLYQVVNFQGAEGDISLSYFYKFNISGLSFHLYGSDEKPANGSSWDDATWTAGNPFGKVVWGAGSSGPYYLPWTGKSDTFFEDKTYDWYTVAVVGKFDSDEAKIDNIIVDIPAAAPVPEPSTIILFMYGLAVSLRFYQKR